MDQRSLNAAELIHRRSMEQPDKTAVRIPDLDAEDASQELSYRDLDGRARNIAKLLCERHPIGSRVLILHTMGDEFASAFVGVLYAGMVAVPAPPPGRYAHQRHRVRRIVEDGDIRVVLTDSHDFSAIEEWGAEQGLTDIEVMDSSAVDSTRVGPWTPPDITPSDLALLQYTSGSTGDPKGVMVTHGNLVHNFGLLADAMGFTESTRYGCWLPLYHDMGLIGHLLPALFFGSECVLMTPTSFLRQPARWLQMIDRYHINHSAAPNFAYEQCVRTVTEEQLAGLDLSCWTSAVNGSEPIIARSLKAFVQRFAPAGFVASAMAPSYGLAEATLFVSGRNDRVPVMRDVDTGFLRQGVVQSAMEAAPRSELVSCGPARGFDLRIVDPRTFEELKNDRIGEIWLRGESVAAGYWKNGTASAQWICGGPS